VKFLCITAESLKDTPPEKAQSLRYGTTASPITGPNQAIGVILTGRLQQVVTDPTTVACTLQFEEDRHEILKAAIARNDKIVGMMRDFDERFPPEAGLPKNEPEWAVTNKKLITDPGPTFIDTDKEGIANVLWTTGGSADLGWSKIDKNPRSSPDFDSRKGLPNQIVSDKYAGLFFAGYPWVSTIQSMNIF
jgi:hypothetical protein